MTSSADGAPAGLRLYLAGPMQGYKDWNFPAFATAAERLRGDGHTVFSPAERDEQEDPQARQLVEHKGYRHYMKYDLPAVLDSDAVAVLPGWGASKGANLEVTVARTCGIPVVDAETLQSVTVTGEAGQIVDGARQQTYGHPADDFGRTAGLWTALWRDKLRGGAAFGPEDVAAGMRMVKESRLQATPGHRDSLVDICGYARTQEKVWERVCGGQAVAEKQAA